MTQHTYVFVSTISFQSCIQKHNGLPKLRFHRAFCLEYMMVIVTKRLLFVACVWRPFCSLGKIYVFEILKRVQGLLSLSDEKWCHIITLVSMRPVIWWNDQMRQTCLFECESEEATRGEGWWVMGAYHYSFSVDFNRIGLNTAFLQIICIFGHHKF